MTGRSGAAAAHRRAKGMTLVEVLVAATLLGLAFAGTTSMLASGRELESSTYLRGQAYRLAAVTLEDSAYNPNHYLDPALAAGTTSRPDSMTTEAGMKVDVDVAVSVGVEDSVRFQDPDTRFSPGRFVRFKRIQVRIAWPRSSPQDSVVLSKRITNLT